MVLTTVPQTALPVLAAEEEIEATAEITPEVVDEDTADDADTSTEAEDVDTDDADQTEDSDTTDSEQKENTEGDNQPPVINDENKQGEEDATDVESEDTASDTGASIMSVDEPEISLYAFEATQVKFTVDGAEPTDDSHASAEGALNGTDYEFTVTLKDGYKLADTDGVKATYTDDSSSEQTVNVTGPTDDNGGKKYTIASSDLDAVGTKDLTIAITTAAIENTVTITKNVVDGADAGTVITNAKYTLAKTGETGTETELGNSIAAVTCEQELTVKFTLANGYIATMSRQDEGATESTEVSKDASSEGQNYVYKLSNLTKNTTLTIDAEKDPDAPATKYAVTVEDEASNHAQVEFLDGCLDADGKVTEGTDLTFTVTPDAGYELAAANAVQYKAGTGTYADVTTEGKTEAGKDIYKVAKDSINGDVSIKVTTAEIAYNVAFDVTGAKVAIGDAAASTTPDAQTAKLGDKVTFIVTPEKTGDVLNKIRYVNTADNATDAMTADSTDAETGAATYTYTVDENTDKNTIIYVNATAPAEVTISFTKGSEVSVYAVTQTGEGDAAELTVGDSAVTSIKAAEDTQAMFIAELPDTSVSKISSVKFGETTLNPTEKDVKRTVDGTATTVKAQVYTLDLTDVYEAFTVTITDELDETKANVASLTHEGVDGYTITVDGDTDNTKYTSGQKILTAADSISFAVETKESYYSIDKVEAIYTTGTGDAAQKKTDVLEAAAGDKYTFKFKDGGTAITRTVEIKVTVSTESVKNAKDFTVNNRGAHSTYKVTGDEKVAKKDGTNNTYTISEGAQYVELEVKTQEKFEPVVTYTGQNEDGEKEQIALKGEMTEEIPAAGKTPAQNVYGYSVPAVVLEAGDIITITEKAEEKRVVVRYNHYEVDVTAKVSGREIEESWTDAEYEEFEYTDENYINIYKVPTDTQLVLVVTANDNSTVKTYQIGETAAKKLAAKGGEVKVSVADNTTVTINSDSTYGEVVKKVGERPALSKNKQGNYNVDYGFAYTAGLRKGEQAITVTAVTLEGAATENGSTAVVEKGEAKITVNAGDAGKTLTVKLSAMVKAEGADAAASTEVHSFKLAVLPKATKVDVTGVKNGKLTQTIDTKAEYALKATPNTVNLGNITAEVSSVKEGSTEAENNAAKALVQASVANGKLTVTTTPGKAAAADAAKITLKDKTTSDAVGSFTVDIAEPALKTEKVTAKLAGATDIALKLELGMSKKVTAPNAGSVWYKVDVTTTDTDTNITNAIQKPFYIKAEKNKDGMLIASQVEEITVNNIAAGLGYGKACDFTVKVSLVQTMDSTNLETAADTDITAATAFTTEDSKIATLNAATKKPYITTKLSLKKGTTTVYTGQKVKIATPQFDKDATWTEIDARNIVDQTTDDQVNGLIRFTVENGEIYMEVDAGAWDYETEEYISPTLGKHTIQVTAFAPNTTVAATATIPVTIVRGIEDIRISAPDTLYKADGKAATLKLTPVFNWGYTEKDRVPKSKKVRYELVPCGNDDLEAAVSVKANGTVTVDKKYRLKADDASNTFAVKAIATDFARTYDVESTEKYITVTSEMMELGEICIADREWNADTENYVYTVPARKTDFTSKELDGKYVIVLKKGVAEKTTYSNGYDDNGDPIIEVIDTDNITFKSSNKALSVAANGRISVGKVANKVKLTATANDGGKKSKELILNINYDQPAQLGLRVERQNDEKSDFYTLEDGSVADGEKKDVAGFTGTSDTVLRFTVVQRDEEEEGWTEVDQYTNFKLTVSGAKVLNKNSTYGQSQTAIANKAETKVKLVYTTKDGTTTTRTTTEYTIKNDGIKTLKAPKVKASGNLATDWDYMRYDDEMGDYTHHDQTITYTVTDTAPEKTYSGKKWVMVATDTADRTNAKKAASYRALENAARNLNQYQPVNGEGKFELSFNTYHYDAIEGTYIEEAPIPAGSYKLQLTFGTVDKDGGFVPDTKSSTVTLKAVAPKKGSYKPVSKVNMSLCDGANVELKGSGKNYSEEDFSNLRNANFGGAENSFQHYFMLQGNDLKLKSKGDGTNNTLTDDEITYITTSTTKEAKNDRIGYVDYSVYVDGVGDVSGTAKITVTFTKITDTEIKPLVTYKASAPTIMEGTKNAVIKVTTGKTNAYIDYAYIPDGQVFTIAGNNYGAINGDDDGTYRNEISVEAATAPGVASYPLDLYLLPDGSYYYKEIHDLNDAYTTAALQGGQTAAAAKQAFENAMKKYGCKVTTTVKVTEKKKTGGKIKIEKADLTRVFSNNQYNGAADAKHYYVDVPYTKTMECEVTEIVSQDKLLDGTAENHLIDFYTEPETDEYGEYKISITVDKAKLEQAVAAGKVKYGQKCSVKATVKFGTNAYDSTKGEWTRTTDADIKEEVFTFSLTMPGAKGEGAATTYAEAVEAVKAGKADIEAGYQADSWKELYTEWADLEEDSLIFNHLITPALDYVVEETEKLAPRDTGTCVYTPQRTWYDGDGWYYEDLELKGEGSAFKAPTSQEDGYFKAVIRLVNAETYDSEDPKAGTYEDITFNLVIPKTMEEPKDVESALNTFISGMASNETYTKAQSEEIIDTILADAREAIKIDQYETLRIRIEDPEFKTATDKNPGYIKGTFVVWGLRYGGADLEKEFDVTLGKLDNITQTKEKIDAALTALKDEANNLTKQTDVFDAAEAAIVNKQFVLSWKQVDKTVNGASVKGDDWTLTPATRDNGGTITGTMVLTNTLAEETDEESNKSVEISFNWPIAQQAGSTAAEAAVKAALAIGSDGSIDTADAAFKALVISNEEETVNKAVLDAANKAVNKDGYTVAYKQKESPATGDTFTFTAAKYKAGEGADSGKGSISFTLVMTDSQAAAGATPTEITVTNTEFGPYAELETLDEAKAEVNAALAADTFKNSLTNETTADNIKTAAQSAITYTDGIKVSVKEDSFTLTEATFAVAGSIKATLVLTKVDEDGKTVGTPIEWDVTLEIAKLTQELTAAKTAAEGALNKITGFTNADIADDTAVTATKKKITDAVEAVVNTEAYVVTIAENTDSDKSFETQAATVNAAGSIKVVVTITEKTPAEGQQAQSVKTAQKTYTIEALPQTITEAKKAAEDAVAAYAESDSLKKAAADENGILDAVKAVIKTESFEAAWSTTDGEGFTLTEAKAPETEGGAGTKGSIKGNIIITDKSDSSSTETVEVSIEWEYVAPSAP